MFNSTIDNLCLLEIPLLDRLFTWTNNQQNHILVRLDQALVNTAWNVCFSDSSLSSMTRTTSDHTPLLLSASLTIPRSTVFWLDQSLALCAFLPLPSLLELE